MKGFSFLPDSFSSYYLCARARMHVETTSKHRKPLTTHSTLRAHSVLERRIATYPAGEVMFNLMALTGRKSRLEAQLEALPVESSGERFELEETLRGIEERMKDWETEVSRGVRVCVWESPLSGLGQHGMETVGTDQTSAIHLLLTERPEATQLHRPCES